MTEPPVPDKSLSEKALEAMKAASREAIQVAKRTGTPVIIWRDGKIVRANPDDLLLLEDPTLPQDKKPSE